MEVDQGTPPPRSGHGSGPGYPPGSGNGSGHGSGPGYPPRSGHLEVVTEKDPPPQGLAGGAWWEEERTAHVEYKGS